MPEITNTNLTLTESGGVVTIDVEYDASCTAFESELVGLGLRYHTHVAIVDWDGVSNPAATLVEFPRHTIPFVAGGGAQTLRNHVETQDFLRAELKGDPVNNDDELKAHIKVHAPALVEFTPVVETDEEVLAD
ncbi:MAG: hypothetical protein L0H41_11105 [Microlunatus sp.]|nr:hypothetical protein [Microlunatus sp.]MDN5771935.1 hypothetical protein [Microlunatus sp.]